MAESDKIQDNRPATVSANSKQSRKKLLFLTLLATCMILGAASGATVILRLSDGTPTTSFPFRPSVVLAVLASVMSFSFAYLLSTGITVLWWVVAKSGTTVEHLHRIWDRTFWIRGSTWTSRAWKEYGLGRLVLASALVPIGGFLYNPLFQLSTRTVPAGVQTGTVPMKVDILQKIPDGLAATNIGGNTSANLDFTAAVSQWYRNATIHTRKDPGYRCAETCRGTIYAPGISAVCVNDSSLINLAMEQKSNLWLFDVQSYVTWASDDFIQVTLTSLYTVSTTDDCMANIMNETCQIEISRSAYNIIIQDDVLNVLPRHWSEWNSKDLIRTPFQLSKNRTMAGPLYALLYMQTYFRSYTGWKAYSNDLFTFGMLTEMFYVYNQEGKGHCTWNHQWTSPTEYILNAMGESLFRLAMNGNSVTKSTWVAPPEAATPSPQDFQADYIQTLTVYKSTYKWISIVWVIVVICLAVTTLMVGNAIDLSRDVSLSPLETLQVFTPAITQRISPWSGGGADLHADELLEEMGTAKINARPRPRVGPIV